MGIFLWIVIAVVWWYGSVGTFHALAWIVSLFARGSYIGDGGIVILVLAAGFWPFWVPNLLGLLFKGIGKLFGR